MEMSRRDFLRNAGLVVAVGATIPLNGDPFNYFLPIIQNGAEKPKPPNETIPPPPEYLNKLSPAAESLYPFLRPSARRRVFSSQRAQVVGVRNWEHTGGIPKASAAGIDEVAGTAEIFALNEASAIGENKRHYYIDMNGDVQEVLPESVEVDGQEKVIRKVAEMNGPVELTTMQFTMFPQEVEFPEGFSFFLQSEGNDIVEVPLNEFFSGKTEHAAPAPFIDPPENAQDAKSFIANVPITSANGMSVYLSDNFFTDSRHFWYNFQMTERTPLEPESAIDTTSLYSELSAFAEGAKQRQDYSQMFTDMLEAHHGPEKVNKKTEYCEGQGSLDQVLPEERTAASFGLILDEQQMGLLDQSTVLIEYDDGEKQEVPAAQFFLTDSAKINHANIYFQTTVFQQDQSKRFVNLNIPLAGIKGIGVRGPQNFNFTSHLTTVNSEVIPPYLRNKKLQVEADEYKTSGGGDDMKLSSSTMDVVCSTVHFDGIRQRQEWPYYYMEQGQSYYRKEVQPDGTVNYMQDGSWSGGEDPWGAFYEGYHPINGGLIKLEEEYVGMDIFRNKGTYWLGLPFEKHMLGVIPDSGADHHFLELNFFSGRRRYEGLEGRVVKIGYRDNDDPGEEQPSVLKGDHYLSYEMNENLKNPDNLDEVYLKNMQRIQRLEEALIGREYPYNEQKPISLSALWRSVQAVSEYYRYIKGTEFADDPTIADLIYRDFIGNSRLVLRLTNYGESTYERQEIDLFFGQKAEQQGLSIFLNTFLLRLGIHE